MTQLRVVRPSLCRGWQRALKSVDFESVAGTGADVRSLHIPPLSESDTTQLIGYIEMTLSQGEKRAILREANGHPLFIQEMVRYVLKYHRDIENISLDAALWERIESAPAPTQNLLQFLAVSGTPIKQSVLRVATELEAKPFYDVVHNARLNYLA